MNSTVRFALLASLALGCTELPEVGAGVCGNGVLESGEDCDSRDPSCRAPDDELACRIDCTPAQDGVQPKCPAGYGCGADYVCRSPSGELTSGLTTANTGTISVALDDFDGDGRADVLATEPQQVSVHFFDAEGTLASTASVGTGVPWRPAIGQLTGEQASATEPASIVISRSDVAVHRGRPDRSLAVTSYSSVPVPGENVRYVVADALPANHLSGDHQGDEILGCRELPGGDSCRLMDAFGVEELFDLPLDMDTFLRAVAVGDLDPMTECDELAVTNVGWDRVTVFSTCHQASGVWEYKKHDNKYDIALPAGATVIQPTTSPQFQLIARLNLDPYWDILVQGQLPGTGGTPTPALFVAYGLGDGTFGNDPDPNVAVLHTFSPFLLGKQPFGTQLPLALAGTGTGPIFVYPDYVYHPTQGEACTQAIDYPVLGYGCTATPTSWTHATIADFNGNTLTDVVGYTRDARKIDFFNGTGTGYIPFELPVTGRVDNVAHGDFDGDLLLDLAFAAKQGVGETQETALSVMFGKPFGGPEPAVTLAWFHTIEQLAAGKLDGVQGTLDPIDDIGVLARGGDGALSAALLTGSTDRQLQSPFTLFHDNDTPNLPTDDAVASARHSVVGYFDGPGGHADIAVLSGFPDGVVVGPSGQPVDLEPRLWLLPSSGAAELSLSTTSASAPLPADLIPCGTTMVAMDLNADGQDEVVVLGFSLNAEFEPSGGVVRVLRAEAGSDGKSRFVIEQSDAVPELYIDGLDLVYGCNVEAFSEETSSTGEVSGEVLFHPNALLDDVDADGDQDLLVLLFSDQVAPVLALFENDGSGRLPPVRHLTMPFPLEDILTSFVVLEADGDPGREVAISLFATNQVFIMDFDLAAGAITNPRPLDGASAAFSMAAGDVNGDGVDDLAMPEYGGVKLWFGKPRLP